MEREAVLFYKSFDEAISMLSDEDQLAVYRAITKYGLYGEETELTGAAGAIFLLAKPQIDANNRRYENGKKGGAPKGNQNATKSKKKTTQFSSSCILNTMTDKFLFASIKEVHIKRHSKRANDFHCETAMVSVMCKPDWPWNAQTIG